MEIRKATQNDIPKIIQVLKASLGEDKLELSERVWTFKHIDNPFGSSIVYVAVENEIIIGVRALMRWEWHCGSKKYSALRAVDTATHPYHRGKGIFKKLTLKAVENSKSIGDHFIFNTPNDQSRPGYLKMGWKEVGKIMVGIKPSLSFLSIRNHKLHYEINKNISDFQLEGLCNLWNKKLRETEKIFTPKSPAMLKWRYENNPLQSYEVYAEEGFYIAAYIKARGKFNEFRISEYLYDEELISKNIHKKIIKGVVMKFGCQVISYSPSLLNMFSKSGNYGPILTLNPINLSANSADYFMEIKNWHNSLGDLELF